MKNKSILYLTALAALALGCTDDKDANTAPAPDPQISSFYFSPDYNRDKGLDETEEGILVTVDGEIDQAAGTVHVVFPAGGVDLRSLTASFEHSFGSTVTSAGKAQQSNISPNDFSLPVEYVAATDDGRSKAYTVTVINGKSSATELYYYNFTVDVMDDEGNPVHETVTAEVDGPAGEIRASVKYEADLSAVVPVFRTAPRSTLLLGTTGQVSGETPVDLSSPVTYTVVSEEGTTQDYTAVITREDPWTGNDLYSLVFTARDNPGLAGDLEARIDESAKGITVAVPDDFDMTRAVPTVNVSPKANVELDGQRIAGGMAYDFLSASRLTVCAQDGTPNDYTLNAVVTSIGSFRFSEENISGMDMALSYENGVAVYDFSSITDGATATTDPIDYINPGKVLSFRYRSDSRVRTAIRLNDIPGAESGMWELEPTAGWVDYSFDLELMARIFGWNKTGGSDRFTLVFREADGANVSITGLRIRPRTDAEQQPYEDTYYLSFTGQTENGLTLEDLTTCYAPDSLIYRFTYDTPYNNTRRAVALFQRIEKDLDIEWRYLHFDYYVEGSSADYQTLNTWLQYFPPPSDWWMSWNWATGASLYERFDTWTPKLLNMRGVTDCWPNLGEGAPKNALAAIANYQEDPFVSPEWKISFELADAGGVSTLTRHTILIRGLSVSRIDRPFFGDFDPRD